MHDAQESSSYPCQSVLSPLRYGPANLEQNHPHLSEDEAHIPSDKQKNNSNTNRGWQLQTAARLASLSQATSATTPKSYHHHSRDDIGTHATGAETLDFCQSNHSQT
jgi:hypothetical protein